MLGYYSRKEEKVNGRYFYESHTSYDSSHWGIWWNYLNWVIGLSRDKGTSKGQSYISQVL